MTVGNGQSDCFTLVVEARYTGRMGTCQQNRQFLSFMTDESGLRKKAVHQKWLYPMGVHNDSSKEAAVPIACSLGCATAHLP